MAQALEESLASADLASSLIASEMLRMVAEATLGVVVVVTRAKARYGAMTATQTSADALLGRLLMLVLHN